MAEDSTRIIVSRRIEAPAERIFRILADPRRHTDLDGSEMLRGAGSDDVIRGVGDVFSMKMYLEDVGDYLMLNYVVEYEPNCRIGWEPAPGDAAASEDGEYPIGIPAGHRWSFELTPDGSDATIVTEIFDCSSSPAELREATQNGEIWIDSMTATLARLDRLCTQ
jgi:RNA polymerase sigma-70 factor, ECF subfamily